MLTEKLPRGLKSGRNAVMSGVTFDGRGTARPDAALAQLVEHIIRNDGVACSSHASGTKIHSGYKHLST
jgi:hypothetical protein